jgi:hypothetical protein
MSGYRYSQTGNGNGNGAMSAMAPSGQFIGAEGASFVNQSPSRRGRGPAGNDGGIPTFGFGEDKFYAGQGGVETYPGCYGLPTYCGWQQVAGQVNIDPNTNGVLSVVPTVSPFFEPKAVYLFGIDPAAPGTNLRFTIGAITVGGSPQLAINTLTPDGGAAGGPIPQPELLSDVFNRPDEPLLVNWSVFSTVGLARELQITVFNLNQVEIRIFACIWGNAVSSLDCYA